MCVSAARSGNAFGYLNKPEATKEKFIGDWLITGDLGHMDEEGYFGFMGELMMLC